MTSKEWKFLFACIETFAEAAYKRGHADGKESKPLIDKGFKPSKNTEMRLQKELNNFGKNR